MTTDIKELVRQLRSAARAQSAGGGWADPCAVENTIDWNAADALEVMAGEVERLKAELNDNSTLAHWAGWKVRALKAEAERDRLKAVLKPRLNAKAIEGLQEILEAMEAMDEREAPFLKTLLDWHEASRKALGDAS